MAALVYILTLIGVCSVFQILGLPIPLAIVLVFSCWFTACLIDNFQHWKQKQ